jgi:hypothetical protein
MNINNIKEEVTHDMENLRKRMQHKYRRWWLEEAQSMLPIAKSWRDAGDTPCRQNQREEAKL